MSKLILRICVATSILLVGVSGANSQGIPAAVVPQEYVDAHNLVRENVNSGKTPTTGLGIPVGFPQTVPNTPLPLVTWDPGLAAEAANYAQQCVLGHGTLPSGVGENIYASSALGDLVVPSAVVYSWAKESQYYDLRSNSCSANCGHYTQVVWSATTSIGCGAAFCPNGITNWQNGQIQVCRYRQGQSSSAPYQPNPSVIPPSGSAPLGAPVLLVDYCFHGHKWAAGYTSGPLDAASLSACLPLILDPNSNPTALLTAKLYCSHLHQFIGTRNNTTFPVDATTDEFCGLYGHIEPDRSVPKSVVCTHLHRYVGSNTTFPYSLVDYQRIPQAPGLCGTPSKEVAPVVRTEN